MKLATTNKTDQRCCERASQSSDRIYLSRLLWSLCISVLRRGWNIERFLAAGWAVMIGLVWISPATARGGGGHGMGGFGFTGGKGC